MDELSEKKLMKRFAVSDANHDFGPAFTNIYDKITDIGTPLEGERIVHQTNAWNLLSEFTVANKDVNSFAVNTVTPITSKTGIQYNVGVFDAHDLDRILPFLYGGADKRKEANILFDAFASSLWEDLREAQGPNAGTINILTNRETINDPGGKISPLDKCFKSGQNKKVALKSYQDSTEGDIVYSSWVYPNPDFYNKFFSNYDLILSSIDFDDSRQNITVDFYDRAENNINTYIVSSGGEDVNSVNTITGKLQKFYKENKYANRAQIYNFGVYLQQKRSGDSLQTLSSLDIVRTYNERTAAALAKKRSRSEYGPPLTTFKETYTYCATNDIWNTCYGILVGANMICMTNKANLVYIFRTGIPVNPIEDFIVNSEIIIKNHNYNVSLHIQVFNRKDIVLKTNFLDTLKGLEAFVGTELSKDPPTTKIQKEKIQEEINSRLRTVFASAINIYLLHKTCRPTEPIEGAINQENIGEIIERVRTQKIIQLSDDAQLERKYTVALSTSSLAYIPYFNFFSSENEDFNLSKKPKLEIIKEVFGNFTLLAKLKLDISSKFLEVLNKIYSSNYITKAYRQSTNFNTIFNSFYRILNDIETKDASPSTKRSRTVVEVAEAKPYEQIQNEFIMQYMLDILDHATIVREIAMNLTGGRTTRKKQRGGAEIPFSGLNCNFLLQRQLNRVFLPILTDILIGNQKPFHTDFERQAFLRYIAIGLAKFLSHSPSYESADHISLWGPVFVEMFKVSIEEPDPIVQIYKLKVLLGVWFSDTKNVFNIEKPGSNDYWIRMASEAGHTMMEFIFGRDAIEELLITENLNNLDSIKFNSDVNFEIAYESSLNTIIELLDTKLIINVENPLPPSLASSASLAPSVSSRTSDPILSSGLSEPEPKPVTAITPTAPLLTPGSIGMLVKRLEKINTGPSASSASSNPLAPSAPSAPLASLAPSSSASTVNNPVESAQSQSTKGGRTTRKLKHLNNCRKTTRKRL